MSTPFSAEQVTAHVERFLERAKDRSKFDPRKLNGRLDAEWHQDEQESRDAEQIEQSIVQGISKHKKTYLRRRPRIAELERSILIDCDSPTGDDFACVHAVFSHVGLPRKRVQGTVFKRTSGDAWLIAQSGYADLGDGPVLQAIPYGSLSRLLLVHMTSYALRHNTREVPIGRSANNFLEHLGMDRDGHRYRALRTQMHALAACRLQLGYKGRTFNGQPVGHFDTWLTHESLQRSAWPGVVVLTTDYYDSLRTLGVPIDMRDYLALQGSALAMDIYTWLTHRLYRIESNRPYMLPWPAIKAQFGQEYKDSSNFKKEFREALSKVMKRYPKANVNLVAGGLLLRKSPPPVAPRFDLPI
ncbi:replication protein RepA [Xanthomonas fragariae]|uniref:Plasmid encoded RepA protein n=1 Tax=Xanthomonas fragariae TaxID=48664 RepID=A0A1Y6HHD8_9XANT|nr:replication protein RepA [Xanthomonas fragariae]MBL9195969.1 replication protein [Xanthomonas fragariae]MBL9220521.1 replication protein [Xanthomonas fragariae]MDM7556312.1 replication protein RepA [Xanthomonas fragariae]MDM7559400.1 replication protein RepA [Xanthomonas fragariae]MDM7573984.1 replication protein RepA [Xanthomonas fragariae]